MADASYETKMLRKSHVTTRSSSTADNGHTFTLTKHTSRASYLVNSDLRNSSLSDDKNLRSRGIELVDTDTPRYAKVSPEQVADYYKSLGDWQNVLPKTDYSYSPVSRFYKKKYNGVIPVIPNMSRRDIRCTPEALDNEINLYTAENLLYEESHATHWRSGAGDGASSGYGRNLLSDAEFDAAPRKRVPMLSSTHSSAKLSRLRSTLRTEYPVYYSYPSVADRLKSTFSSAYCATNSLVSSVFHILYLLMTSVLSAVHWLVVSVFGAVYTLTTDTASATASLARYTYSSIFHRFRYSNASTSVYHVKSPAARNDSSFWKLLFAALLILLLCASFRGFVSVNGDSNMSVITAPVSKSYSFLSNLVFGVYDLTCASTAFVLSVISAAATRLRDEGVSAVGLAPLYQLFNVSPVWHFSSDTDNRHSSTSAPSLNSADIEKLFRHWLATASSDELARKILDSDEFVRFIDEKLRRVQRESDEKLEEFAREHSPLRLERLVAELEAKFERLEMVEDAAKQTLEQKIAQLREEIAQREQHLEKEVIVALAAVLGVGGEISADELRAKFTALFASLEAAWRKIDLMEAQFAKFAKNSSESLDAQFERSARDLKHDLRVSVEEMVSKKLAEWKASEASGAIAVPQADYLEAYVKGVVRKALEVYDADKTGLADYALESSGGIVLSTRCTETRTANAQFSIFGIPLWHTSRGPRAVIQPGVHPGECWAFPGSNGYLVIQLSERIFVTGVTLEHIPRSLAPNGTIDSAPKDFSVWALRSETDSEPALLGKFRFEVDGPSLQYFETNKLPDPYLVVELKIHSNHGKVEYTCLYRFRVHGVPA